MKLSLTFFFILLSLSLSAQINPDNIWGNWVKTKITYPDGIELPDDMDVKYSYVKYCFSRPDKIMISQSFNENSKPLDFGLYLNQLEIHVTPRFSNNLRIEKLTNTELILVQKNPDGSEDQNSFKYYFTAEKTLQNSMIITPNDILSTKAGDTIYKENPKIYAVYKINESFHSYLTDGTRNIVNMDGRTGHFKASFIISKTGIADSLKILESIDPDYDRALTKVFNKAKKSWNPATLNGKPVTVQRVMQISYSTSQQMMPNMEYSAKANEAFAEKDYKTAMHFYDRALESMPGNTENLYRRAICEIALNNQSAACEDLQKIKATGSSTADVLIAKYCH